MNLTVAGIMLFVALLLCEWVKEVGGGASECYLSENKHIDMNAE